MDPLTADEIAVVDKLTEAYNAFLALPDENADDAREFAAAIHMASAKVLMRPARRSLGSGS